MEHSKLSVKKRITELNDTTFSISFRIPINLQDDYNMLIEEDMGYDDSFIVEDCVEEVVNDFIVGYVLLSFDKDMEHNEMYETVFARASQFDMLANGMSLIAESEV